MAADKPKNATLKIISLSAIRHTFDCAGMKGFLSNLACGFVIVRRLLMGDCWGVERS